MIGIIQLKLYILSNFISACANYYRQCRILIQWFIHPMKRRNDSKFFPSPLYLFLNVVIPLAAVKGKFTVITEAMPHQWLAVLSFISIDILKLWALVPIDTSYKKLKQEKQKRYIKNRHWKEKSKVPSKYIFILVVGQNHDNVPYNNYYYYFSISIRLSSLKTFSLSLVDEWIPVVSSNYYSKMMNLDSHMFALAELSLLTPSASFHLYPCYSHWICMQFVLTVQLNGSLVEIWYWMRRWHVSM